MPELRYVTLTVGGRRIGVDRESVRSLLPWSEPMVMPRSAPWVQGLVLSGGEVVPVVRQAVFGPDEQAPSVLAVLGLGGRLLGVPGHSPGLASGSGDGGVGAEAEGFWSGEAEGPEGTAALVDVLRLYTLLGLHYN